MPESIEMHLRKSAMRQPWFAEVTGLHVAPTGKDIDDWRIRLRSCGVQCSSVLANVVAECLSLEEAIHGFHQPESPTQSGDPSWTWWSNPS